MRLFIGIGLPLSIAEALARATHSLLPPEREARAHIRLTRLQDMHVTLSFLGHVEPSLLEQIQQSLAAVHADRMRLELNGAGIFANGGILLAKVEPSPNLLSLAEQVLQAMEHCGFPREQRPFMPHVTLARSKGRIKLVSRQSRDPAFRQAFKAGEFCLYQSFTYPEGSQYQVLRAFPLA
jgi:RNA 2',3'-cyclic 3'-phosphodiesterase